MKRGLRAEALPALGAMLALYGLLGAWLGTARLGTAAGPLLVSERLWAAALALAVVLWVAARRSGRLGALEQALPYAAVLAYLLFLCSNTIERRFGFLLGSGARAEIPLLGAAALAALLLTRPRARWAESGERLFSWPLLLFAQCAVLFLFYRFAAGRIVFSDDHPSFLYRLHLLAEHFPAIPFYNVEWNAGYSAREFFPSGMLNFFVLTAPYLFLWNDLGTPERAGDYSLLLSYVFVVVVPLSVYAAARVFELSRPAAILAALLAIGPSSGLFEWLLSYGTIGFAASAGFVPLTIALAIRLALAPSEPKARDALSLFAAASLCLSWTLSAVIFLPLVAAACCMPRHVLAEGRRHKVLLFLALYLAVNGPWLYRFATEAPLLSFLSTDTLPGSTTTELRYADEKAPATAGPETVAKIKTSLKEIRSILFKINPLLLFFFLPGLYAIRSRRQRLLLAATVLWLLLLAALGDELKPQLELRRMALPASFLLAVPAAAATVELVRAQLRLLASVPGGAPVRTAAAACVLIVLLGAVIISPITAGAAWLNRSHEKFVFSSEELHELNDAIRRFGGEGRTFFLGFILHELEATSRAAQNGGHVAALAAFSGKMLYASDFYHRKWSSVDPIPAEYRLRGQPGIEEFLDLVNATAVVTFTREWVAYCQRVPGYRQVAQVGRFRIFTRRAAANGFFLRGAGTLERAAEGIVVTPQSREAVLKFRYLPQLRVSDEGYAELFPVFAFNEDVGGGKQAEVQFIGLRLRGQAQPGRKVAIGFHPEGGANDSDSSP